MKLLSDIDLISREIFWYSGRIQNVIYPDEHRNLYYGKGRDRSPLVCKSLYVSPNVSPKGSVYRCASPRQLARLYTHENEMHLFPCKILLSRFICVQYPDLQVKTHISFPTLLRSFTGPLTGAFDAGQASEVSPRIKR